MRRRILVFASVCAIAAAAGTAGAQPPGSGGPEPVNPPAVGLCASLPHPTPNCSAVTVACLSTCKTRGTAGPAGADVRELGLQLPRRYSKAVLSCRAAGSVGVACKLASRTLVGKTGVHVAVMQLPQSFASLKISCTSRTKLACVVKRVS